MNGNGGGQGGPEGDGEGRKDWEQKMEHALGAEITELDAKDLVGRLVINEHGAEFVVTRLSFEARDGSVWIWVAPVDDPEDEAGVRELSGWSIHQPLRPPPQR